MRIAITGASGRLARLVTKHVLAQAPTVALRLLTRNIAALDPPAAGRLEYVAADFENAGSLDPALTGVDVLLIISTDAPLERRLRQHLSVITAAVRNGVGRVVYTSFMGARLDSRFSFARIHAATEAALQTCGVPYTILRNTQYAEMLDGFIAASMGANCLIMPSAESPIAYVPRENAAAAAAGALLGADHENKIYKITGNQALTAADLAALIGSERRCALRIVDANPWEYLQATMIPFGAPQFVVHAMEEMWETAKHGEYASVSRDAEALAAGPLIELSDYVRSVMRAGMM